MQFSRSCSHFLTFFLTFTACFCGNSTHDQANQAKEPGNHRMLAFKSSPGKIGPSMRTIQTDTDNDLSSPPVAVRPEITLRRAGPLLGQYKLPSWFNYDQFKRFFGKRYSKPEENEVHKRIYLRTALKVFEQRALYRTNRTDILPSINELSDMTSSELLALKRSSQRMNQTKQRIADESTCCTYDQVHRKIIELLDGTIGADETDLALSRAYVDELKQKPISDSESAEQATDVVDGGFERIGPSNELDTELAISSAGTREQPVSALQQGGAQVRNFSHLASTRMPAVFIGQLKLNSSRSETSLTKSTHPHQATAAAPIITEPESTITPRQPKNERPANGDLSAEEPGDFERAIEESVRQQIERQLSPNTSQGRQLTERLSSYFGQPVKLTASLGRPSTTTSTKSPSLHLARSTYSSRG